MKKNIKNQFLFPFLDSKVCCFIWSFSSLNGIKLSGKEEQKDLEGYTLNLLQGNEFVINVSFFYAFVKNENVFRIYVYNYTPWEQKLCNFSRKTQLQFPIDILCVWPKSNKNIGKDFNMNISYHWSVRFSTWGNFVRFCVLL